MRKVVAEKLTDEISDWGHRGLISNELLDVLKKRYSTDVTLGRILLRWLGFLAVYMLGTSILGTLSLALGDMAMYLAPLVTGAIGYFMWLKGTQMATDPEQLYPTSGAVLVTAGLLAGFATLLLLHALIDDCTVGGAAPYFMLITGAAAFFTAYRYGLRWPLTLGVLLVFHGLGNMHSYGGHGSYFVGVQDERLTVRHATSGLLLHEDRQVRREFEPQTGCRHGQRDWRVRGVRQCAVLEVDGMARRSEHVQPAVAEFGNLRFLAVMLVLKFTENLLDDVFQGDQTGHTTELVYHDRHMLLPNLKLPQQFSDHFCLRHEKGFAKVVRHDEFFTWLGHIVEEVLYVQDTDYLVNAVLINREPGMSPFLYQQLNSSER